MKYELEKMEACVNKWASENVAVIAGKEIAEFQQFALATIATVRSCRVELQ